MHCTVSPFFHFLLLFTTVSIQGVKFVEQISTKTIEVLHGSRREQTVRQCTCQEMNDCYESAKKQAISCFDPCWKEIGTLTERPENLKVCFDERKNFIDNVVNCFKTKIKACAEDEEKAKGVQVKTYDYHDMIKRVEDIINDQIQSFLRSVTSSSVKQVVEAVASVARCIKTCFIEKNKEGFCFDRTGCEPNIADRNAKLAIRQCSRQISWKTEIGELCKCSSQAGVGGIADYCGMLNVMG